MKKTFFLSIAVCLLASCGKLTVDNTPVASIELDRYLGTWYEIARFDHSFERGLTQPQAADMTHPNCCGCIERNDN